MVGYIKFLQRRGKITTRYKKLVYFITPVRKARLQVFLLLFAPFGDDWREYCSYPQVPFPSVISPAVIESWPPFGDRRLFAKLECFIKLLHLQGAGRNAMIPRAMPWARSFWAFSPFLNHMRKFSDLCFLSLDKAPLSEVTTEIHQI